MSTRGARRPSTVSARERRGADASSAAASTSGSTSGVRGGGVTRTADADAALRTLFGRDLGDVEVRGLAGGIDNAHVRAALSERGALYLEATARDGTWRVTSSVVHQRATGATYLHIDYVTVTPSRQGQGTATRVLLAQVRAAAALGLDDVRLTAARSVGFPDDPSSALNGYYTWPRLGFDAPLSRQQRDELARAVAAGRAPQELAGAGRVSDLMRTSAGRAYWKQRGNTTLMTFDLAPDSLSQRVLAAYAAAKGITAQETLHERAKA